MRDLTPPPLPTDEQTDAAAATLATLSTVEGLAGWLVKFRRVDLGCLGVYEPDCLDQALDEIVCTVPELNVDCVDPEGSRRRNQARHRLAVQQAIEANDLELGLMREAVGEDSH